MLACVADPGTLVLKATKSGLVAPPQLAEVTSKENFAGYWPAPTVAPGPNDLAQSRLNLFRGLVKGVAAFSRNGFGVSESAIGGSVAGDCIPLRRSHCCQRRGSWRSADDRSVRLWLE